MQSKLQWVFVLILVCKSLLLSAQNSVLVNRNWLTRSTGLPTSDMYCGVEDARGFVWLATKNVLSRYDGTKFEVMKELSAQLGILEIDNLFSLDEKHLLLKIKNPARINGPRKYLVFNTLTFEISALKAHFEHMPFADSSIVAVYRTKDAKIGFFTAHPGALYTYSKKEGFVQKASKNTALKKWTYTSFTVDNIFEGTDFLYVGYQAYKSILITDSTLKELPNRFYGLLHEGKKKVDVFYFDTTAWKVKSAHAFLPDGKLYESDFKKLNWTEIIPGQIINCDNGPATLVSYKDGKSTLYIDQDVEVDVFKSIDAGENAPYISSFFVDRRGNYWICTVKGVMQLRVSKSKFKKMFTQTNSFNYTNHSVRGIYADKDITCAALYNGIAVINGSDTSVISRNANYGILKVDTGIWISGFVLRFYDFRNKSCKDILGSPFSEIWTAYPLKNGELLLGCTNNLARYNVATKSLIAVQKQTDIPVPNFVYRFFRSASNELIAVADNGIYYLSENGEIIDYYGSAAKTKKKHLPITSIHDLYIDKNNSFWFATGGQGLCQWKRAEGSFRFFDLATNFPSNVLYCLQEDKYNNIWISSDFGLIKFNKNTEFVRTYSTHDGIADNEFNRSSQFKDQAGTIYFGGINGLTAFNPDVFEFDTIVSKEGFYLTSFAQYNKELKQSKNLIDFADTKKELIVTDDDNFITLSFTLLDYLIGQHQYAYKIEGLEDGWTYSNETTLRLINLPYGSYRLVIKARAANGNWNNKQIEILIKVVTPYYKTLWFQLCAFLILLLVIIAIFYLSFRQRVLRLQELSDLRMRIASSLHDEVGGVLNKTAMQAELALKNDTSQNSSLMQKIADNSRMAISNMRDVMWNLDSRNDFAYSLVDRMKEYALQMFEDKFNYSIEVKGIDDFSIDPELRQTVFLIYKEAVNNILKHGTGSEVEIKLIVTKTGLQLVVFSTAAFVGKETNVGQGLRNMRWRAEKKGGKLTLDTANGVEISVVFPVQ